MLDKSVGGTTEGTWSSQRASKRITDKDAQQFLNFSRLSAVKVKVLMKLVGQIIFLPISEITWTFFSLFLFSLFLRFYKDVILFFYRCPLGCVSLPPGRRASRWPVLSHCAFGCAADSVQRHSWAAASMPRAAVRQSAELFDSYL